MKKRLTRGEKWLFASPLLFIVIAGAAWWRQNLKSASASIQLPDKYYVASRLLEYSPDGRRLLVFTVDSNSKKLRGVVYDVKSRNEFRELAMPPDSFGYNNLLNAAWSADGRQILLSSLHRNLPAETRAITVWDVYSGAAMLHHHYRVSENEWMVGETKFAPDGKTLVGGGVPLARYDAATGKRLNKPDKTVDHSAFFAAANPKLGLLAKRIWKDDLDVTEDRFELLDLKTRKPVWTPKLTQLKGFEWHGDILCLTENIQTRKIVVESGTRKWLIENENHLWLWDGQTRQRIPSPPALDGASITSLCFFPDGRTLAYVHGKDTRDWRGRGYSGELVAWDYRANRVLWRYQTSNQLTNLRPSPNSLYLSVETIEDNPEILVFNSKGELRMESARATNAAHWSPDSKQLAALSGQTQGNKQIFNTQIDLYDISHSLGE